jgi:hypothetical protein
MTAKATVSTPQAPDTSWKPSERHWADTGAGDIAMTNMTKPSTNECLLKGAVGRPGPHHTGDHGAHLAYQLGDILARLKQEREVLTSLHRALESSLQQSMRHAPKLGELLGTLKSAGGSMSALRIELILSRAEAALSMLLRIMREEPLQGDVGPDMLDCGHTFAAHELCEASDALQRMQAEAAWLGDALASLAQLSR